MTKDSYLAAKDYLTARPKLLRAAVITQKICELAVYVIYPLFLAVLIFTQNDFWWKSALVCGISFVAVSLLRIRINAQRPYEKYGFSPLIKKESKGRSFPSRHAFSAAIIAFNIGVVCIPLGVAIGVIALVIAFLRVVLGVHFIKDAVFGIIAGIVLGGIVLI